MNKLLKIICILMLIIFFISSIYQVNAGSSNFETSDFESGGNDSVNTAVKTFTNTGIAVMRVIAVGIAVIVLLIISIKYMTASPSGKADVKKYAIAYVIGTVLLFAGSGLLELIYNISKNIE